jgi:hypothetical protein
MVNRAQMFLMLLPNYLLPMEVSAITARGLVKLYESYDQSIWSGWINHRKRWCQEQLQHIEDSLSVLAVVMVARFISVKHPW